MSEVRPLTLDTICEGGVPEVFERELRAVLNNIADPNTEAEKVRGITLKFSFRPTEDRLGASVTLRGSCGRMGPTRVKRSCSGSLRNRSRSRS